jgi:two-component system nitrogen regulation sensor histidine kinase NtrY
MLKRKLYAYRYILFASITTLSFLVSYFSFFTTNYTQQIALFQQKFSSQEQALTNYLANKKKSLLANGKPEDWHKFEKMPTSDHPFLVHVFRHDSLVYWNTNYLPIMRFKDIHFPSDGIMHLQNGWYFTRHFTHDAYTVCVTFSIKSAYSYENAYLTNSFSPPLELPFPARITLEELPENAIYSNAQQFLFSVEPQGKQLSDLQTFILLVLLFSSVVSWLILLFRFSQRFSVVWRWIFVFGLVGLRMASIQFVWFGFLRSMHLFEASLYGANEWFPSFFDYLLNILIILYLITFIRYEINRLPKQFSPKTAGKLLTLFPFLVWVAILHLTRGLVENGSIPLLIDQLFTLNIYSLLALTSIAALFHAHYTFSRDILLYNKHVGNSGSQMATIAFILSVIYFLYEINSGQQLFLAAVFPGIFFAILVYYIYRESNLYQLGFGMLFLALYALVTAQNLAAFSARKEKIVRELYANQLATEQDIATELAYAKIATQVKQDPFLLKFTQQPKSLTVSDFEEAMDRRIFSGFWERYEMNFRLFDTLGNSLIHGTENQKYNFADWNKLLLDHGKASEIDSCIYSISDYTGQYSYIIRQPIYSDESSKVAYLFCTLKSKKIPEQIGFPRLLISAKAYVFESLENYSIAKYHQNKLLKKYGDFNYPTTAAALNNWQREGNNYYHSEGYSHYVLEDVQKNRLVLSLKSPTWLELLTSFSYLFCLFGLALLPIFFQSKRTPLLHRSLSLAERIQFVLIGLVVFALFASGWASGIFVRSQYNEYTNEIIREKLRSVEIELRGKISAKRQLTIEQDGNYVEFLLQKFSKVFVTDINFYDTEGFLIASSRPKIYNIGLLSEHMNPAAMHAFFVRKKSEFVHNEKIGNLQFASAYLPFTNADGRPLGFVNLQHFGQQTEFENQIQKFLVAIINVFMLLLALSIVFALFIANWVTSPLRLLQDNFSKLRFGKHNQQITYHKNDEIGALVKDYNQKLEELENAAHQLAKNEREGAWREMAKQVAHEIKNPLTPMKLSIQQLLRVYDTTQPDLEKKLQKVAYSIIEQIDALANIANEFSNFAKLPTTHLVALDLLPILRNVFEVFQQQASCKISLTTALPNVDVLADKDQMIRVFNNLLKNALDAIPLEREGEIHLLINLESGHYVLSLQDNGIGIPEEQQPRLFVPNFTTKTSGSGLGLAMVKQIIEHHRGTIRFETRDGQGTTFILVLPHHTESAL